MKNSRKRKAEDPWNDIPGYFEDCEKPSNLMQEYESNEDNRCETKKTAKIKPSSYKEIDSVVKIFFSFKLKKIDPKYFLLDLTNPRYNE